MKQMILLFSHTLSDEQREDAKRNWDVENFIALPKKMQIIWSNISPDKASISETLEPVKQFLSEVSNLGDLVLVQGDFGASYHMVNIAKEKSLIPVYATTERSVKEIINKDGKIEKTSIFKHRRFRRYE